MAPGVPRTVRRPSRKSIYDPIHGAISLEGAALELIGQPSFQRLWGIRQTGLAHLVFPGANHTRLEHSLGVAWVAGRMAEALEVSEADRRTVVVGGLLHDLGHGPFSHSLDGPMEEVLGHGHERLSRFRIEGVEGAGVPAPEPPTAIPGILERHGISPARVAALVDPAGGGSAATPLLRSILHGPVDADRTDYLQRDAHYTGVAHGAIDAARLLETLEADRGRPVFAEKGRSALEGFLLGRTLMYNSVYYHKTVRAAEVMLAGGVERFPGYPDAARPLFGRTDGDLLVDMERAGGFPAEMALALRERRLYKRIGGFRTLPEARRRELARRLRRPADRRALEEGLAAALRARPGQILLDPSGLGPRRAGPAALEEIGVREGNRTVRPFARSPHWRSLLLRPPSLWALAVYAHPARRRVAEAKIGTLLDRLP